MFFLSLKGFAQVPLKTTADQEDALVLSYNTTHSIDVVVAHFNATEEEKKRKGKALIFSGLGATVLGIAGIVYAASPGMEDTYLINAEETAFIINPFTSMGMVIGVPSTAVMLGGLGMMTLGTFKYIKSK